MIAKNTKTVYRNGIEVTRAGLTYNVNRNEKGLWILDDFGDQLYISEEHFDFDPERTEKRNSFSNKMHVHDFYEKIIHYKEQRDNLSRIIAMQIVDGENTEKTVQSYKNYEKKMEELLNTEVLIEAPVRSSEAVSE